MNTQYTSFSSKKTEMSFYHTHCAALHQKDVMMYPKTTIDKRKMIHVKTCSMCEDRPQKRVNVKHPIWNVYQLFFSELRNPGRMYAKKVPQ